MVLSLKCPKSLLAWSTRSIEGVFSSRYNVKRVPFKRFVPAHKISKYLNITPEKFLDMCATSRTYHGLLVNGEFFVHPDCFLAFTKKHYRLKIKKELKKTEASNLLSQLQKLR